MSNLLEGTSLNGGLPTESIQLPMPGVEELTLMVRNITSFGPVNFSGFNVVNDFL